MYQIDPVIRLKRLKSEHAQMIELAQSSRRISFVSKGSPADRYLVTYLCKGTILVDGEIRFSRRHVVEIRLHANYPYLSPRLTLRTPLFHPNFKFGSPNLSICIEANRWQPRVSLPDLVIQIGNMIVYRNYNPRNPLDADAARWAEKHRHLFPLEDTPWIIPASIVQILETTTAEPDDDPDALPLPDDDDEYDDLSTPADPSGQSPSS
jgi:ubiquitin-protein ligase